MDKYAYHSYNCKYRPAGIGAIPTFGLVSIDDDTIIDDGYGIVTYNRQLTEQELHDYELEEVDLAALE